MFALSSWPRYRWIVLALAWLVALNLRGLVVAVSPVLPLVQAELRLTFTQSGVLFTLPVLLMGGLAIPGGWLADRYGARFTIVCGLWLTLAGAVWRSGATGYEALLSATFLLGAGIGICQPALPRLVREWFPEQPGTATGLYSTGFQIGAGAAAFFTGSYLLTWAGADGWRWALLPWAGLAAVGLAAWMTLGRDRPGDRSGDIRPAPILPLGAGGSGAWRRYGLVAWLIAALFAGQGTVFYLLSAWLPTYYVELGWDLRAAGGPLAAFAVGMVPFTIALPYLSDRMQARRPFLIYGSLLIAGSAAVLALFPGWWPLSWAALCGVGITVVFALCLALPVEVARPHEVGALSGFVLTAGYLGATAGPYVAGFLRDLTGSFAAGLWFCVLVGAGMAWAGWRLPETAGGRLPAAFDDRIATAP